MHGHDVEERRERDAEEQEERGEEDGLRRVLSEERPRHGDEKPRERGDFEADLEPARAEEAEREERERREQPRPRRRAERGAYLLALRPDDVERKERHVPAERHVLQIGAEHVGRMMEQHGLKPPQQSDERHRHEGHARINFPSLHI